MQLGLCSPFMMQVITFIDLAGHEKYLKTTVFGLTGHAPDFAMLMIGSNMGIVGMTKGLSMKIALGGVVRLRLRQSTSGWRWR